MKALIQRVKQASVIVDGKTVGRIDNGLLVLLGVAKNDNQTLSNKLLDKVLHYRIFADNDDKMNLNVQQINGELLVVSQFTLVANTQKGLRPSFVSGASPVLAEELYEYFVAQAQLKYQPERIQTGQFAADMQVSLINDGPGTFMLEVD